MMGASAMLPRDDGDNDNDDDDELWPGGG